MEINNISPRQVNKDLNDLLNKKAITKSPFNIDRENIVRKCKNER